MVAMALRNSLWKLLNQIARGNSGYDRYWELEGLCKTETLPQVIMPGVFGGPVLTSSGRR